MQVTASITGRADFLRLQETVLDFQRPSSETLSNAGGHAAIPLALRYNSYLKGGALLAVADEEGFISIVDSSAAAPRQLLMRGASQSDSQDAPEPLGQWRAHSNAVFGMQWIKVCCAQWHQAVTFVSVPSLQPDLATSCNRRKCCGRQRRVLWVPHRASKPLCLQKRAAGCCPARSEVSPVTLRSLVAVKPDTLW